MVKFRLGAESDADKFEKLHCVGDTLEVHELLKPRTQRGNTS